MFIRGIFGAYPPLSMYREETVGKHPDTYFAASAWKLEKSCWYYTNLKQKLVLKYNQTRKYFATPNPPVISGAIAFRMARIALFWEPFYLKPLPFSLRHIVHEEA